MHCIKVFLEFDFTSDKLIILSFRWNWFCTHECFLALIKFKIRERPEHAQHFKLYNRKEHWNAHLILSKRTRISDFDPPYCPTRTEALSYWHDILLYHDNSVFRTTNQIKRIRESRTTLNPQNSKVCLFSKPRTRSQSPPHIFSMRLSDLTLLRR